MERTYQVTLMNWLTRRKKDVSLGDSRIKAKEKLKIVRKRYNKLLWIKITPIFC